MPLHWKTQQTRLKYLVKRLQKQGLYKDNGPIKNCGHQVLKRKVKNTQIKKGLDLPNYWKKQRRKPKKLAKHLPKTNDVLNQSSIRFVGHRKVLQREP